MNELPYVIRKNIFEKIGSQKPKIKWFYPSGLPREITNEMDTLSNQLKFCLVYPEFLTKLDLNTKRLPLKCLYLLHYFPEYSSRTEKEIRARLRNDAKAFEHIEHEDGSWEVHSWTITDIIGDREEHSDWAFRYYCEYLAFLIDLSVVRLEDSSSLMDFARRNKFKKSEAFLADALLFS
ncbi:Oidioi.mRNA.OKI2018_I69.chr1.g2782.t1.cds [Oikopleura dioica]|uniref:Oidioi.mRNA.OKI2018_I69.chr1.g2782.t1.cds n=1 Tax=Oikopleura dioica TaxID=34765 RepID=A0ABN7SXE9_OIKDI|nr:Oidioi.mRNA.OKI2018_I69.chr1.g2782.t1.cds [Oikopleura dioica]